MDDAARAHGHDFVELAQGRIHLRDEGPDDGPAVVLIHGTNSPMFTYDHLAALLVEAGFRVLRFDMFGRGLSDRPRGPYDLSFFVDQVRAILDRRELRGELALVGWSLGAVIAAAVAVDPGPSRRVSKLTLLAPAGFPLELPFTARMVRLPVLGELTMALVGLQQIASSWRRLFIHPEHHVDYGDRFVAQLDYAGFTDALLSTLRLAPLEDASSTWADLAAAPVDTLICWGRRDEICPYANLAATERALPKARAWSIDNVGHALHIEAHEPLAREIVAHLDGHWPAPVASRAEAEARARQRVERVADHPWDRYGLRQRFYARHGGGGADDPQGYGESELAFLRWEVHRGVLDAEGSAFWRAVNAGLTHDSELAGAVFEAELDDELDGAAQLWLRHLRAPSIESWYRAHNASIVRAYLEHRELARRETLGEQQLLDEVLYRAIFAQALATGDAVGPLGALVADPRRPAVELITGIGSMYPCEYPAPAEPHTHDARRGGRELVERALEEALDEAITLPQIDVLYAHIADELGIPDLVTLADGYP